MAAHSKLEVGDAVIVETDDEFHGLRGVIREAHHHRGEPSSYRCSIEDRSGLMSFIDGEIRSTAVPERKRRSDAGVRRSTPQP